MRKSHKNDKKNDVKLDDFLFGGDKEGEQIAKRRAQRESAQIKQKADDVQQAQPVQASEEQTFSSHNVDNKYFEQAAKIADEAPQIPAPAPKTRPAAPVHHRPQQARPKASDSSIEDLMKMMDEEQKKLRSKMDN